MGCCELGCLVEEGETGESGGQPEVDGSETFWAFDDGGEVNGGGRTVEAMEVAGWLKKNGGRDHGRRDGGHGEGREGQRRESCSNMAEMGQGMKGRVAEEQCGLTGPC